MIVVRGNPTNVSPSGSPREVIEGTLVNIWQHLNGTIRTSREPTKGRVSVVVGKGAICMIHLTSGVQNLP